MRQPLPAAELGVLPVEVLVLHEEDVQRLRADMGHQGEHHRDPLAEADVRLPRRLFHPAVAGRAHFLNTMQFASLTEIELDGDGQYLVEPLDMFTHHASVLRPAKSPPSSSQGGALVQSRQTGIRKSRLLFYRLFALAPITSASCSKSALSFTGIPPTSVVGSTRPAICCATCHASCGRCCSCPGATWMSVPCV